jgi:tRNA A37 threonylcarbamoyladenosine biosynthesis protein TsaE
VRPHPQATGRKHFADAFDSSSGIGFEFQSSDINPCDVESREKATPHLRWIYNLEKDQCHLYSIQDVNNGAYAFLELPLAWQRAIPKATYPVWFTDRHFTAVYRAVSNQISEVKLSNTQKTTPVSGCVVQAMDAPTLWNKGQFYRVQSAPFPVFSDHNNYVMGHYISLSDVELSLSTSPESCSPWQTIFEKCAMEEHEQSEWYLLMCHLLQTGKNDGEGKWQVWGAKNLPPFYLKNSSCNWLFNSESFRVYYSDMAQFYVVEPLIRRWEIEFNNSDPANHVHLWGTGVPPLRLYSNLNGTFEYSLSDGSKSKIRGFIALEDNSAIPSLIPNETVKKITKEHSCVSKHEELYPCSVDSQRQVDPLMRDDICERLVPRLEKNQKLAVQAPAGSGKTTLLLTAGKRLFRKNILYITFNKELQREALSKCPSNMHPQTFDSLTREAAILHADQYRKRTDQMNQVQRSQDIREEIHQSFRRTFPEYAQAKRKKRWWNPYDGEYDTAVNVTIARFQAFCNDASVKSPGEHGDYNYSIIKQMWRKTTGYEWITFDGMRKLCHTTNALGQFIDQNYQFVFVDEVQDLNPVMLDVLDCQVSTPCVFVGDAYQSIYGFMGTVNLLLMIGGKPVSAGIHIGNDRFVGS